MYLWCGCTVVADHFKQLSEPHDGTEVATLLYGGVRCIYEASVRVHAPLVYLWWWLIISNSCRSLTTAHRSLEMVNALLYGGGGVSTEQELAARVLVYLWWRAVYLWSLQCSMVVVVYPMAIDIE